MRLALAVFKRDFFGYFASPTGYVFITLFVFLSAVAAFWQERFFQNNLANLDQLNAWFPYLAVFLAPAIAMGLWADERKQGTEELLLTLPATNTQLLLGKYFAGLGIYTVALAFSLSHVVVLFWLGTPDVGLLFSTYFGYWLVGAALLPLAILASQLTENLTVSFILGAALCAIPVFLNNASAILTGRAARLAERLSAVEQFRELASGIVTAASLIYFVALAASVLYLDISLVGRKRWPQASRLGLHFTLRALACIAAAAAVTNIASQAGWRADVTSEQIHSLSADTRNLIRNIDPAHPVFIQAYLSPEVPRSFLQVRSNIVSFLREFNALGRDRVQSRIIETIKYSTDAREARERYGILPVKIPAAEEGGSPVNEIFLGLVFTSGQEEFVIPYFDRGLPVEYELMRSIRVVSHAARKKVGILETSARLFGGLDFQSRTQSNDWPIIAELKKQYDVVRVPPDADYPADLNVLLAVMPTTLTAPQIARLTEWTAAGKPVLALLDPMPAFNLGLAPAGGEAMPPDMRPLLKALGVEWSIDRIAWDKYNPHPQLRSLPPEVVFVAKGNGATMPFQTKDEITAGLQEVVMLYPGYLRSRSDAPGFVPLLTTGKNSGLLRFNQLVQSGPMGGGMVQGQTHNAGTENLILAAKVNHAITIADSDLIGEQFFELRKRGIENMNFDNVTFVLNAVDDLAGDRSFIALRKRRPKHRTLEALEARTQVYEARRTEEANKAQAEAETRLQEAQQRLDMAVRAIEARSDLDSDAKETMMENVQSAENRRLVVARANVEDERQRQIENARASMEDSVRSIQNTIKILAVTLPPVPAFVLFILVSLNRLRRERIGANKERIVE